ncbi:MAG: PAS domain S-box protein [Cyanobacteria bacterium P01_C01_bin.89]
MATTLAYNLIEVLKASQTLSSVLDLEELSMQITQVFLHQLDGDRCILAVPNHQNQWLIRAIATPEGSRLYSAPLSAPSLDEFYPDPIKLIEYVNQYAPESSATLPQSPPPLEDPCYPLWHHNQLLGIVHLEGGALSDVDLSDRQRILELLCNQGAIALHNAQRYEQEKQQRRELQHNAEATQRSQSWFQELFHKAADAMLVFEEGRFTDCNFAAVKMFGGEKKEDLLGLNPLDISPEYQPDGILSREKVAADIALTLKQGHHRFEWLHKRFNGTEFWAEITLKLITKNDRTVFYVALRNIGHRKAAEAALAASEAYHRNLLEHSAIGLHFCKITGELVYANPAYAKIIGRSPDELPGLSYWEITPKKYAEQEQKQLESLQTTGRYGPYEKEYIHKDGHLVPIRLSGVIIERDGEKFIWSSVEDISDRKAVEFASRKYLEKLGFLIQETPIGIVEWNTEFEVIGWNPTAAKIFGYSAVEILGTNATELLLESDREAIAEVMVKLMEQRGGFYSVNRNVRKDGKIITCEWINTPLRDSDDNAIGIFSMVQDVSDRERDKAEILSKSQELENALQELQQTQLQLVQGEKMASLGNLVAGIAHEINNPVGFLNGSIRNAEDYIQDLFGYLETYQKTQPPADSLRDHAEDIELDFLIQDLPKMLTSMGSATDRIKRISKSLCTFSRADTENKISTDVHEGINSTLLILKYRLKANENRPAIEVSKNYGDLPEINCFPGQLNQVFMNLLANAIDACEETNKSRSFLDIEKHPNHIAIDTRQVDGKWIEICIRDNGCGMTETQQKRTFEQGFTTKAVGKGTGLGMAIARQIVEEKHGGTITCDSKFAQGTLFTVTLPT